MHEVASRAASESARVPLKSLVMAATTTALHAGLVRSIKKHFKNRWQCIVSAGEYALLLCHKSWGNDAVRLTLMNPFRAEIDWHCFEACKDSCGRLEAVTPLCQALEEQQRRQSFTNHASSPKAASAESTEVNLKCLNQQKY